MTQPSVEPTEVRLQSGVGLPGGTGATLVRDRVPDIESLEHELKFVLASSRVPLALAFLSGACRPDSEYPHGIVTSIYYDTADHRLLAEKINSDYLKSKLRVRWYSTPEAPDEGGPAFLEVKFRVGARRDKARLAIPDVGSWLSKLPLHDRRLKELPALLRAEGCLLDPRLTPVVSIQYERRRLVEPSSGARVSVDTGIRVLGVNLQVTPPQPPTELPVAVIEVKGNLGDLPPALYGLTALGARRRSLSKYGACLRYPREGIL
jgi:hypothetical protein